MTRPLYAEQGATLTDAYGRLRYGETATVLYADPARRLHVQTEFRPLREGEVVTDFYGKPAGVVTWSDRRSPPQRAAEAASTLERSAA